MALAWCICKHDGGGEHGHGARVVAAANARVGSLGFLGRVLVMAHRLVL